MSAPANVNTIYEFGSFHADVSEMKLFRGGEEIPLKPKAFDLLLLLLERRNQLVTKRALMDALWTNSFVEESNLTQHISELRRVLGDNPAEPFYIKTVPKRGYKFIAPVEERLPPRPDPGERSTDSRSTLALPDSVANAGSQGGSSKVDQLNSLSHEGEVKFPDIPAAEDKQVAQGRIPAVVLLVLVFSVGVYLWWRSGADTSDEEVQTEISSPIDVAEIRQVVRDSQTFEFLTLHVHPEKYEKQSVPDYWLPPENGGEEILKVWERLDRLKQEKKRYGEESRLERFDFTYVKIYAPGDRARTGTIERWYLPLYQNGKLIPDRNVYLGPYPVDYILRKAGDRWLIERTTTPTAK